ncbi:outer membrane beta-barrel protein [Siphonobacter aquaeclarae]|uniref:Outer membrane protein beta-barrel domain-containing protein n=1 Tax=Siphonobacter aquaeclarae TaxID=563176 RepID=A0A1G9U017_9BACT|nr:outer membrane beta-barrel protein [Siphonobacter aquaeclarae]SDM53349.1 Outer membrane protein beta-barrel domain-containing protein [Siphonobacter aquaeclarae]
MSTLARRLAGILLLSVAVVSGASAQVAFSLHGTVASTTLDDSKVKGGLGANVKFFLGDNLAVGAAVKYISLSYEATELPGGSVRSVGSLIPITGTVDYYFTKGFVRPYIGGEVGAYIHRYDLELNGNNVYNSTNTRLGATPKLGLTFALGNFGIFAEGNYHFIFSNKDGSANIGSANNVSFKNPDKLWGLNVGITFGLPK